ncbi:MAG: glycosyltransferase family 4 protein [bacterium]|nr:glycosyltransferase family 4 protein [bacterium]
MKDVIFLNSHPIQYFAPLYKFMNEYGVKTSAWYCSDESIRGALDKQFGVDVKWDIPLLEGYNYKFFKNYSWKPSQGAGFLGLINLGVIKQLFSSPKSVIVVHGWNYFTHLSVLLLGKILGHTICLRCEMPLNQEMLKTGLKQKLKNFGLKYLILPRVNYCLYIGTQNKNFYKYLGVKESRLIFCPYSVDNKRFTSERINLEPRKSIIKQSLGIPISDKIILYSGKYLQKKRPMDLLAAFHKVNIPNSWLILLGEGELRNEIESYVSNNHLKNVILTGFINQSKVSEFYSICDVFVMCSEIGETWGLSVNEAMNFNVPIILSDLPGSATDLIIDNDNGCIFKTGDISQLSQKLEDVLLNNKLSKKTAPSVFLEQYSYKTIADNLKSITIN